MTGTNNIIDLLWNSDRQSTNYATCGLLTAAIAAVVTYYSVSWFHGLIGNVANILIFGFGLAIFWTLMLFVIAFVSTIFEERMSDYRPRLADSIVWASYGLLAAVALIVVSMLFGWFGVKITSLGIELARTPYRSISTLLVLCSIGYVYIQEEFDKSATQTSEDNQSDTSASGEKGSHEIEARTESTNSGVSEEDDVVNQSTLTKQNEHSQSNEIVTSQNLRRTGSQSTTTNHGEENMNFDWKHQTGVSMEDIGGMKELKNELRNEVIKPLTSGREKAEKLGINAPNILFYGPPGTGKTYFAKALATELGLPFVKISGADIQSKWINASPKKVQQLFIEAKIQAEQEGGSVIFLDELDSVLSKRDGGRGHEEDTKVVNEFLNHLEETKEHDIVFIGATNRVDELDNAATRPGRIDRKIEIGLPDVETRASILETQLQDRSYKIAEENIETIAQNMLEYSAADIQTIVEDAARHAAFERDASIITLADLEAVDASLIDGTDPKLESSVITTDPVDSDETSDIKKPNEAQEFSSVYRVVGFGDQARRMALYDLGRDDTAWVNTIGYRDKIHSELEELQTGNLVEATITNANDKNEYWDCLEFEIVSDDILYYVQTDGYAPGPIDEFWKQRQEDTDFTSAARRHDDTSEYLYEVHVQADEVMTEDGEMLEIYPNLQRGEILTEPLFQGHGCDYLDKARAVIAVNPDEKEYVVLYIFEEKNDKFDKIWGGLYHHVEGE